jgi:citronellol/citronellal dehydrogenase
VSALVGKVVFMTGGSRGIGLAIATKLAEEGARVALMAKTDQPHPKLPGTIHTAAEEIRAAGGEALPIVGDVRDADAVARAVDQTAEHFGGIDILVNNASAINLAPMRDVAVKRFDLMFQINTRGTFVATKACLPYLRASEHAHVLTLSPPVDRVEHWLAGGSPYTLTKMGMTMLTLGVSHDEPDIAANCLWPRTLIATAAVQNLLGGDEAVARARTPEIVGDAAREILRQSPSVATGRVFIDDEVLMLAGFDDLDRYAASPGAELGLDLYVDGWLEESKPDA